MSTNNYYTPAITLLELVRHNKCTIQTDGTAIVELEQPRCLQTCPHCGNHTDRIKDYRWQKIYIGKWLGVTSIYIRLHKRRYYCPSCERTFYEKLSWLPRYQQYPLCLKQQIVHEASNAVSFSWIAKKHGVSITTVIRYFDYIQIPRPEHLPTILSIDEFRGNVQGHRFQVSLVDPVQHKILDILPNRDTNEIINYFYTYPEEERRKVKYFVMDMSPIFRKAVRTVFPKAVIIGDRFHIQRLVNWAMEAIRKRIQKDLGARRIRIKRSHSILCKPGWKVTERELPDLEYALGHSKELRHAYALKEAFYRVWKMGTAEDAKEMLRQWLSMVRESKLEEFSNILLTFKVWEKEIIQAVIQPYSNGPTEGKNTKIKTLKRISYGIRNFRRFRNRILFIELFTDN